MNKVEELIRNLKNIKSKISKYSIPRDDYMAGKGYHYTSVLALQQILTKQTLYLTNSEFLNDREEILYGLDLIDKIDREILNIHLNIEELKNIIIESLRRTFILSYSLNADSLALWGNYTSFEGYNIGFDFKKMFKYQYENRTYFKGNNLNEEGNDIKYIISRKNDVNIKSKCIGEVIYNRLKQEEIIRELISAYNEVFSFEGELSEEEQRLFRCTQQDIENEIIMDLIHYVNLFKHPGYQQEEEYRFVYILSEEGYSNLVKFRNSRGLIVPYIEMGFNDDKTTNEKGLPICSITIGPKLNMQLSIKGLERLLEFKGYNVYKEGKAEELNDEIKIFPSLIPYR